MQRASAMVAQEISKRLPSDANVFMFCGMGNNGGDGLNIADYLIDAGVNAKVFVVQHGTKKSADFEASEKELSGVAKIQYIKAKTDIPKILKDTVVIDAIFGSGLNRKADGIAADVINAINKSRARVYSVDVPSGLFCDKPNATGDAIVQSTTTFTFHAPKLSFLLAGNQPYVPQFQVLDIGLSKECDAQLTSSLYYINKDFVQPLFKRRQKFSHKGDYGHALIAAGSFGKMGAAVLAVKAALRSGVGLASALIPVSGYEIMQTANPEAMVQISGDSHLATVPNLKAYNALAAGPGIGTDSNVYGFIRDLLNTYRAPMVLDADALNIIAEHPKFMRLIPENSVLTPHPGEFKRLTGNYKNDFEKLKQQIAFSKKHKVVLVLKGAHTSVTDPAGNIYFNSTGNPGMAKGGSGDVLTGIITSLMAQNYAPADAAALGVYLHGLAGDLAKEELGETAIKAGDIIYYLPKAFKSIEDNA